MRNKEVEGFLEGYSPNNKNIENILNKIREDNLKKDALIESNHKTLLDRNIQELKEKIIKDEKEVKSLLIEILKIDPDYVFNFDSKKTNP